MSDNNFAVRHVLLGIGGVMAFGGSLFTYIKCTENRPPRRYGQVSSYSRPDKTSDKKTYKNFAQDAQKMADTLKVDTAKQILHITDTIKADSAAQAAKGLVQTTHSSKIDSLIKEAAKLDSIRIESLVKRAYHEGAQMVRDSIKAASKSVK